MADQRLECLVRFCTCSKQTSSGFDGSDTNSSIPQGTNSERRSASWADSRSGRRSLNVELTKIRIRVTVSALFQTRCCGTAHAPAPRPEQSSAPDRDQRGLCFQSEMGIDGCKWIFIAIG